jgi:hypothetical protein
MTLEGSERFVVLCNEIEEAERLLLAAYDAHERARDVWAETNKGGAFRAKPSVGADYLELTRTEHEKAQAVNDLVAAVRALATFKAEHGIGC